MKAAALASLAAAFAVGAFAREISWAPSRFEGDSSIDELPLRFSYFPTAGRIRVSHGEEGKSGVFTIRDAKGEQLFRREVSDATEWSATIPDLKAHTLKTGEGGYVAEFAEKGGETMRVPFRRDVFEWEGNTYGLSDTVPPPFGPVDASEGMVRTVLREHTLGSLGFPSRIVAAGEDVLSAPMQLLALRNGRRVEISGGGFCFTERRKTSAKGFAEFDAGFLKGRIDGEWWCDGMYDCQLTLLSGEVDELYLRIPLRKEIATHMHAVSSGTRNNYAGRIPDGRWIVWHGGKLRPAYGGDYCPYLWVGGPLRGVSVFGENDKGWVHGRWTCQDVRRTDDGGVEVWLNFVQGHLDVARPRTIHIGMQATPVKPMEDGWRAIGGEHLLGGCWYWGCQTPCNDIEPYDGTDRIFHKMAEARRTGVVDEAFVDEFLKGYRCSDVVDPASAERRLAEVRRHVRIGLKEAAGSKGGAWDLAFYTNGRGIRLGVPPGSTFCDEWRIFRSVNRGAFSIDASGAYELEPVRSYLDYAATCWRRIVGSGACDYIYFDCAMLTRNLNSETSDAFRTADGSIHAASGIFNMREQVRRCAVTMAEMGKPCRRNWIHMSRTAMAPISAFAGLHYDFEDNNASTPLQERYSRDYLLAETIGRQFGVRTRVMCYFDGADPARLPELVDSAMGVMLTHELEWRRMGRWNELRAKLLEWGYGASGTRVWNYWDAKGYPLSVGGIETSSLAMRRADGEALAVVSSWEKKDGVATLRPSAALADDGCEAEDLFTGERLQKEDGAFALPLEGYRWRIVRFRPSAAGKEAKGSSTDVVECRYPMYVPWATEVEIEPIGGGKPYMTFVKHGNIVIRGRPGERFRCKWHDLNGTPDQMEVELK